MLYQTVQIIYTDSRRDLLKLSKYMYENNQIAAYRGTGFHLVCFERSSHKSLLKLYNIYMYIQ